MSCEARVARRENVRIATLIQMTMGLRITEVRTLTCDRVLEVQGSPSIAVPSEVAKNHTSRVVPFLDPRVIDVVEAHRQACEGVGYVIGSPADRTKLWDKDYCQKAIAELCKEWARGTGPFLGLVGDCVVAALDPPDRAGGAAGEEGADPPFRDAEAFGDFEDGQSALGFSADEAVPMCLLLE